MNITELRATFSSRIRKLREGKKLNQGEFADSVGISRGAMSYYEQEARTPDIGVLRAICEKYNISADYLLGIIPNPNHAVSDVCRATSLSPGAANNLRIISMLINSEIYSNQKLVEVFGDELIDAVRMMTFTSLPELISLLLEDYEGCQLLALLGAIIYDAKIDMGESATLPVVKIKSPLQEHSIEYPLENLTASLWVNIQNCADKLKLSNTLNQKE